MLGLTPTARGRVRGEAEAPLWHWMDLDSDLDLDCCPVAVEICRGGAEPGCTI